jgi:hypothetical protein
MKPTMSMFATLEDYKEAIRKEKPVVQIYNAKIVYSMWYDGVQVLTGLPVDHPRDDLNFNEDFSSSKVIRIEGNTVETENSIYKVLGWRK